MARKTDHPASALLRGMLHLLDGAQGKRATDNLLVQIKGITLDALEVLKLNDPLVEALATPILVLKRCTSVSTRVLRGKEVNRVTVTDPIGYGWAMKQIHSLGEM